MTSGRSPTEDRDDDEVSESASAGSFLRQVAFAPHVEPRRREPDRTGETLGHFQIVRLIGRGGMGVVYEARDLTLRRKVALKLLRADAIEGPEHRRRFLREARAAAAVSHPNIVTVFETGEVDGNVFIAMELVDGADARAWLAERPRTRREILDVFTMAGRGLAAAHRAGLVHRDFKPDNVLVDATGRARVADFGLAAGVVHSLDPSARPSAHSAPRSAAHSDRLLPGGRLTQAGRVMGTPGYIAPECLVGGDADARADQFAFCVALFEALEGRRPYDEATLLAGARSDARAGARPARPRKAPLWLRGALTRGLAVRPGDRFPSMNALLVRMERARLWSRRAAVTLVIGAAAAVLWAGMPLRTPEQEAAARMPAAWLAGLDHPSPCIQGPGEPAPVATPASDGVDGVRRRIAEARALLSAGKYAESAALGQSLRRDAQGVPAVEADAFAVAAIASWKAGRAEALQWLLQARWAAERARCDALSTELALSLCEAYRRQGNGERAAEWLGHAEATLARVGKDPRLESMVLAARAELAGP